MYYSFEELIEMSEEEVKKELDYARGLDNNEFWKFTRLANPSIEAMLETNMYYRMCRLVNKYYKYINKPVQIESENNLRFSHRINTCEKMQTLDKIMYTCRNKGEQPKIIIL